MATTCVLINNYNNGPYLRACVESALDQTQPADEVIVYDDGSTDDSLAILRQFGARIVVIAGARTGLPSRAAQARAVAEAFRRSCGELVFLLDGDDRFQPAKIAAYTKAYASRPGVVLVQAPMCEIDASGAPLGVNYEPMKHKEDYLRATYRLHDVDFYYPTSALAFARRFLTAVLPLDFSDGIELPIDTRLGIIAPLFGGVVTLPDPYSDWRRHTSAYTVRQRPRIAQMQETMKRTQVFNRFCREHRFRPIHLWRNRRFYLQVLRVLAPSFLYSFYYERLRSTPTSARPPS
jgi:glycosyltransferase involved in cell wall biosynthesis